MLKLAGGVLVLLASWGYGAGLIAQVRSRRDHLSACRELLELLLGEIKYGKTPLGDAFVGIAQRLGEPFQTALVQISEELADRQCASLQEIWNARFREKQKELLFSDEEMHVLYGIGKNLGYLDADMQMRHLALCQKQVEEFQERTKRELREKTKLYRSLSLAAGAMAVLLLI